MKPVPLTLDTLQSKTAESDSVFFFQNQHIVIVLFFFYFWQKLDYIVVVMWRSICESLQSFSGLLVGAKDNCLALWLEHLAAIHSSSSSSLSSSFLECELAAGNQMARELWINCYWDLILSIWHSVNLSDNNLSLGNLSLWSRLPCQPPPVTRQHRQACVSVATVGHLDAALCRPLVAWLYFVLGTGHEEGVWQRAGGCVWWAQRWAQCLQRVAAGHQLASLQLLGDTYKPHWARGGQ